MVKSEVQRVNAEAIKHVKSSFARSILNPGFVKRFYQVLFESYPRIKPMFAETDLVRQSELLKHSITLLISYANGDVLGESGLKRLRKAHNKKNRNTPPHLYDYGVTSLIKTVSEFDQQFNSTLMNEWREILFNGIEYIKEGYDLEE